MRYLKDGKVRKNMTEDETLDLLAQSHYILNGTVRENIVMGQKFDENRYVQALRNAALIADINESFPQQDKTGRFSPHKTNRTSKKISEKLAS